jgi:hypothetical protein
MYFLGADNTYRTTQFLILARKGLFYYAICIFYYKTLLLFAYGCPERIIAACVNNEMSVRIKGQRGVLAFGELPPIDRIEERDGDSPTVFSFIKIPIETHSNLDCM